MEIHNENIPIAHLILASLNMKRVDLVIRAIREHPLNTVGFAFRFALRE
jgi:hypothetical protein